MRQRDITEWTGMLVRSFGRPKPPINPQQLHALYAAKDYNGMLRVVRAHLKLNMRLRAGYVNGDGPQDKRDCPAWIESPSNFPMYGTREFSELKLTVYLKKSFLARAPSGAVSIVMAHELSHVVLNSTGHALRMQEEAVDLTAMLLGFRKLYLNDGSYEFTRKVHPEPQKGDILAQVMHKVSELLGTDTETMIGSVGYLTHEEREYANWVMERWP